MVSGRNGRIDVLRGIAILLVLIHHFNIAYPLGGGLVHRIARNGNYGVTMFFAISGFLITSNALSRWGSLGAVGIGAFYRRRAARIVPTLVLLVAVVNVLGMAGLPMFANQDGVSWAAADAAALGFWMNVLMGTHGWFNYALCVLWSLSVEEVFYLAFPVLAVGLRGRWFDWFLLAVIVAGPVWRAMHADDEYGLLYAYLACFDGIAIGCAARLLAGRFRPGVMLQGVVGVAMAALYLGAPVWWTAVWGVSAMAAGTAVLLIGADADGWVPEAAGPMAWAGRHSYELYLGHLVPLGLLRTAVPPGGQTGAETLGLLAVYAASAGVLALVVARLYAEPLNRALRSFGERAQPRPAT